jgi:pimeloyl-ACP methyl ester carboxylesterase
MASQFVAWHESEIHYIRRGMGDPLLLVHNLYPGASCEEFEHNIDSLAHDFTVYAIDLLGFGQSTAPRIKYTADTYVQLLLDFIQRETKTPISIMASGLTCAYVNQVAIARPGLVNRLVYICPRSEPVGLETPRWLAPLQRVLLTSALGSSIYETLSGEYELTSFLKTCFYDPKNVTPALVRHLHEQATKPGSAYAIASLMTGFLDSSILKTLPHVTAPILLLWGDHAKPTPVEHSIRLRAVAKYCHLQVLENSGTWPHHEQSAKVNRLVKQFLIVEPSKISNAS